jgi:hypothetical protein
MRSFGYNRGMDKEIVEAAQLFANGINTGPCPNTSKFLKDFIEVGSGCSDHDQLNSALGLVKQSARGEGVLEALVQSRFWQMILEAGFQQIFRWEWF